MGGLGNVVAGISLTPEIYLTAPFITNPLFVAA
jgi:hypothetical protein